MEPVTWPCPLRDGSTVAEFALSADSGRAVRLVIIPALFDEANKLRHFTTQMMRRLQERGIDSFLPDLPGCNESLQLLAEQTPDTWSDAMVAAAAHFGATAVFAIRGGALLSAGPLPTFHYAPAKGTSILRQMLRARVLAAREAGREENRDVLDQTARSVGIELSGYKLGAHLYRDLAEGQPIAANIIAQEEIGGSGLWLRAEPDHDPAQSERLADLLTQRLTA